MKKALCIVFLVVLLSSAALAQEPEIPTLTKHVNDYANVLSDSEESRINALCSEIESNWTVEIAVLTIDTTQSMSIEEYSVKVFEKNGIGKKDKDNGLLIVAAIQDRNWRLEVGYGLEPIITDSTAGKIGRAYLIPYFQQEKYGEGLYNAVDAVAKVIQNSGDDSFISDQGGSDFVWIAIALVISLTLPLAVFVLILINYFSNKCPGCGARMKCHYTEDYEYVCECPKCGKKVKKKKSSNFWFFVGGLGHGSGGGSGGGGGGGFGGGGSGGGGSSGGW